MALSTASFTKALEILEEALNAYAENPDNPFIRDACIQRFEYSYELAHKMLRRYLQFTESTTHIISDLSFPSLIRLGYERGLVRAEWSKWKEFREARNITSHACDESKALDVMAVIPDFLSEAQILNRTIQHRQESEVRFLISDSA